MTTKTISAYVAGGYTLSPSFSELDITTTGGVGGLGVYSNHFATISNAGKINETTGADGINLTAGGAVINQRTGSIFGGAYGILVTGSGSVTNLGTIRANGVAISLHDGGAITNGGYTDLGALIEGGAILFNNAAGTVTNFATIAAGVAMYAGGAVTNGAAGDTTASISGAYDGVHLAGGAGTVTNFGAIHGHHNGSFGVDLSAGGRLTNGTAIDQSAVISGYTGVIVRGAAGTIANFGTIQGFGPATKQRGVYLLAGGYVTNGSAADANALIEGANAVFLSAAGTIVNFGAIAGATASGAVLNAGGRVVNYGAIHGATDGIALNGGGTVINGGHGNHSALIEGSSGLVSTGGAARVLNFGTIRGTGFASGVDLQTGGGTLTNGSPNNNDALIEGYIGLSLNAGATATNFGTISGTGDYQGYGALLISGDILTNGDAGHAKALIEGFTGVDAIAINDTVTNFGTIRGTGGTAVRFNDASDTLVVETGCAFVGAVLGGGGTLDLDSGTGTLTGLLAGGSVTVSGSMAATAFSNFATVEIGAAATFATSGAVIIAAGQTLIAAGSLTLGGAKAGVVNDGLIETLGGALTVKGAVTGSGSAAINGGTLDFASSFNEKVTFSGTTGILELAQSQAYTATVIGFSKNGGTFLDLDDIAFVGAGEATYVGTKKSGVLTVTDGTHTAHINLKGDYRTSTFVAASDGHGGTIIHDPPAPVASWPPHQFIAAMAGLGAGAAGLAEARADWTHPPPTLLAPRAHFA